MAPTLLASQTLPGPGRWPDIAPRLLRSLSACVVDTRARFFVPSSFGVSIASTYHRAAGLVTTSKLYTYVDALFFNCAAVERCVGIVLKIAHLRVSQALNFEAFSRLLDIHLSGEADTCGFASERQLSTAEFRIIGYHCDRRIGYHQVLTRRISLGPLLLRSERSPNDSARAHRLLPAPQAQSPRVSARRANPPAGHDHRRRPAPTPALPAATAVVNGIVALVATRPPSRLAVAPVITLSSSGHPQRRIQLITERSVS